MTSENQRPSGNRRGRSGRNRRPAGSSRPDSDTPQSRPKTKPKGLFAKIADMILGSKPPARRAAPTTHPTLAAASAAEKANSGSRERADRGPRGRGRSRDRSESEDRSEREPRSSRKPELVEVTSPKLYVGNLSFDATESDLSELFNGTGSVQSAEVVSHRDTQRSKGFAFVTMGSTDEAQRAVDTLHDQDFMGRKLVVSGAKTSDVRNYSDQDN